MIGSRFIASGLLDAYMTSHERNSEETGQRSTKSPALLSRLLGRRNDDE